jgi:hypothetical protein
MLASLEKGEKNPMKVDGKEACTGFVKTAVAQKRYML